MEARKAHWNNAWKILKLPYTITGYSRAAYRTGFYIKELDTMFDAGPQNFNKPSHIFITHTHGDHIANLPFTMIGDEDGKHIFNLYAPKESTEHLKKYIKALFETNASMDLPDVDKWYVLNPMMKHIAFEAVLNKNKCLIEVFDCDHSVPTVSYGISIIKNKLKPEFSKLSGKEIGALRKSGVEITEKVFNKDLAYICDTSIDVFKLNKTILSYKVIIIECTFLYPEHEENADKTKHIHWNQLKPYILENPETLFVLIHFSLQYKDKDIESFFEKQKISNIKAWI